MEERLPADGASVVSLGKRRGFPDHRQAVERRLAEIFAPCGDGSDRLYESVRHSLLAPGKRIRPALTLATAGFFGSPEEAALDPACAIEMVHTASLIVDDLPSMDDARLRRRRPANHRVFGEHVATLAAFELLSCAFGTIARSGGVSADVRARLTENLTRAIGAEGLIGGQMLDLESGCRRPAASEVAAMYGRKTGALLRASVEFGALVAGVTDQSVLTRLADFSHELGLAFQILDDLHDRYAAPDAIGKDVRQDAAKTTLLSYISAEEACAEVDRLIDSAAGRVEPLGVPGARLSSLGRSLLQGANAFVIPETERSATGRM